MIGARGVSLVADVVGDRAVDAAGGGEEDLLVGLAEAEEGAGALDVGRLGDVRLLLARGVADDGGEVDDGVDAVERLADAVCVADVALDQLEEAVLAAGQQAVPAELERVEDADAVALLEEHRDQRRAHVAGSAGDQNSHGEAHPWWLWTRLERRGCR